MDNKPRLTLSVSPHVQASESTTHIMADVLIALTPAMLGAVIFFGLRAVVMLLVSAGAAVFFEWGYRRLMKKDSTTMMSAVTSRVRMVMPSMVTPPTLTCPSRMRVG